MYYNCGLYKWRVAYLFMMRCETCGRKITKKEDANVLAFLGFVPKTFCNNCYSSKERGFSRHFLYFPRQPINSKIYIIGLCFFTVFLVIFSLFALLTLFSNMSFEEKLIILVITLFWIFIVIWQWTLYFITKRKLALLH